MANAMDSEQYGHHVAAVSDGEGRQTTVSRLSRDLGVDTPVLVLGSLELIQALGRAAIPCVSVSAPDSKVRLSRYVQHALDAPPTALIDPADRGLVEAMLSFARAHPKRPLVFCDSDEALEFLSANRAELEPHMRLLIPESDVLRDLGDKSRFQALAERCALPVPRAEVLDGDTTAVQGLRFPVVVKPYPHRGVRWREIAGDEKAIRVADPYELSKVGASLKEEGIAVIVQELVPGPEADLVSYHVYVDQHGAIAGEFTGRKIRTAPPERGMSTALVTTDDPAVAETSREVIRRLDLKGPAKLDFKRASDGTLHLLEINTRFTLWVHAGAVAGVNLPALAYADLTGGPRPAPRRGRAGVRWVSLRNDAAAARALGMSRARWTVWALRCETNSGFSWRDPAPLFEQVANRVPRIARRLRA
jgi:predicted ATP-grasp superfamily ATP-dependent carboligase